jgi:hypothetical protein
MKITKKELRQIIKETIDVVGDDNSWDEFLRGIKLAHQNWLTGRSEEEGDRFEFDFSPASDLVKIHMIDTSAIQGRIISTFIVSKDNFYNKDYFLEDLDYKFKKDLQDFLYRGYENQNTYNENKKIYEKYIEEFINTVKSSIYKSEMVNEEIMKLTKTELRGLIKESINKHIKKQNLEERKKAIQDELNTLYENEAMLAPGVPAPSVASAPEVSNEAPESAEVEETPSESIFDSKPGETVILNFEGVTLKIKRQLDDLFKVVDAAESKKLKDGDYVKIQGNDTLDAGRSFNFIIYRQTPLNYETNPLNSWKIIKN